MGIFGDYFWKYDPSNQEHRYKRAERLWKEGDDFDLLLSVIDKYSDASDSSIRSKYNTEYFNKKIEASCISSRKKEICERKEQRKKSSMKISVITHGAQWFLTGINEIAESCPECNALLCPTSPDNNQVIFEHPIKQADLWKMKCQCTQCGCIYTISRTDKEIKKALKEQEDDMDD